MQLLRKIPRVMLSQHPDNAKKPYWHTEAFVNTHHELEECFLMFSDLAADEMMWDWEGKLVDESVVEKLLGKYPDFFKKNPLGKEVFLTFRVPNPRVESGYRLGRAFMVILSSQALALNSGLSALPLFEVILPMTESAEEMLAVQKNFQKLSKAAGKSFGSIALGQKVLEVIPIFESIDTMLRSGQILYEYASLYQKHFRKKLSLIRPFCARSDPALNSGIVPTTLAIKWALSEYAKFSQKTGIPTYPIIAPGSLPFRGGLTPDTVANFISEFAGISTLVIQSSFRYDYPLNEVQKAIKEINNRIESYTTNILSENALADIKELIAIFEKPYKKSIEKIASHIKKISVHIPSRRERVQHVGLFGYSRQVGKNKLPRAIGFAASCYSLGIPPELLGTGIGLMQAKKKGKLTLVELLYQELKPALIRAGRFFRKESLKELDLLDFEDNINAIEGYLGQKLGPITSDEIKHAKLVEKIISLLKEGEDPKKEIEEAAVLRLGLG